VDDTKSWRLIIWFNRPVGRTVQTIIDGLALAVLGWLISERSLVPAGILFVALSLFNLLIAYGTQEWQRRALHLHVRNIYPALQYELAVSSVVLRGRSTENFQLAIMLHHNTETWFPEVRYNMEEGRGKHRVTFQRGTYWMAFADLGLTAVLDVTDENRRLLSEEDRQCFEDVSKVMVSPIFQHGHEETRKHIIGVLVVYSQANESVLEREDRHNAAKYLCKQLARLLNQDYWVS
jgi:hypothetical protein